MNVVLATLDVLHYMYGIIAFFTYIFFIYSPELENIN